MITNFFAGFFRASGASSRTAVLFGRASRFPDGARGRFNVLFDLFDFRRHFIHTLYTGSIAFTADFPTFPPTFRPDRGRPECHDLRIIIRMKCSDGARRCPHSHTVSIFDLDFTLYGFIQSMWNIFK
jgi:hypothetical protein